MPPVSFADQDMALIADGLASGCSGLTSLDLGDEGLATRGMMHLAQALSVCTLLKELTIRKSPKVCSFASVCVPRPHESWGVTCARRYPCLRKTDVGA